MFLYFELIGKDKAPWSGFSYALDSCDVPAVFDGSFWPLKIWGRGLWISHQAVSVASACLQGEWPLAYWNNIGRVGGYILLR